MFFLFPESRRTATSFGETTPNAHQSAGGTHTGPDEAPDRCSNGYFFLEKDQERFKSAVAQTWHRAYTEAQRVSRCLIWSCVE